MATECKLKQAGNQCRPNASATNIDAGIKIYDLFCLL